MSIYKELLRDVAIPEFYKVTQKLDDTKIACVKDAVNDTLTESGVLGRIKPGYSVAVAVGSREIKNEAVMVRTLCDRLKEAGAYPFIIPAMGSHGGAVAENQTELIAHFGITEDAMGVPVRSSMETILLGTTENGVAVHFDKNASEADAVIPVGRIKVHTCFQGEIESGLIKMLVIGCGKQKGASALHAHGFKAMPKNILDAGRMILGVIPVAFGLGILENAYHETYMVKAVAADNLIEEEQRMLETARGLMPRLPFSKIDVLLIDEMGKNISGTGIDPNITGRSSARGRWEPYADRIVIFDLADESNGSAYGMGNADIITERLFSKIIFENTYPNGITNRDIMAIMMPPVMPSDQDAVKFAILSAVSADPAIGLRIVWLHNTLQLDAFYITEALLPLVNENTDMKVECGSFSIQFDEDGNVREMCPHGKNRIDRPGNRGETDKAGMIC